MPSWIRSSLVLGLFFLAVGCSTSTAELVSVQKVWDQAPHSAFTDLVRFQDRWYCIFREGESHVSQDGSIRVISSTDGKSWSSSAQFSPDPGQDLRDPKIVVTPDGRLMLLVLDRRMLEGERYHDARNKEFFSLVSFSQDGKVWTIPERVAEPDFLLFRVTWHHGVAYGGAYTDRRVFSHRPSQKEFIRLYKSENGVQFDSLINVFFDRESPSETSIVFREDETAVCLLRRDGIENSAQVGTSSPPYTKWNWKSLDVRIGGPHLLVLPDGRLVASGRLHLADGEKRTALWWLDPDRGKTTEIVRLPSGGDTSYPGMVFHDSLLWVSYYSSHEEKTAIYLAKVKLGSS